MAMKVYGLDALEERFPKVFCVKLESGLTPPRIAITQINGGSFMYLVATDSTGIARRGPNNIGPVLELGSGDRALVSPIIGQRWEMINKAVEIAVDRQLGSQRGINFAPRPRKVTS